jgi:hypothetical protein
MLCKMTRGRLCGPRHNISQYEYVRKHRVASASSAPPNNSAARIEQLLLPSINLVGVKLILRRQLGDRRLVAQPSSATFAFNCASNRRLVFFAHPSAPPRYPGAGSPLAPGPIFGVRYRNGPTGLHRRQFDDASSRRKRRERPTSPLHRVYGDLRPKIERF